MSLPADHGLLLDTTTQSYLEHPSRTTILKSNIVGGLKLHSAEAYISGFRTQRLEQSTEPGGEGGIGTWRRRAAEEFLLREMTQSCEGAMKSLRSDACSAGENLLDDMAGRAAPTGSGACGVVPLRLRDDRNQSALPSLRTSGGAPAKPYSRYAAAASLRK
jgi:hypothetical protein